MARLIIIRGYPGSGKTAISKLLEKDGHGVFIDHNKILTFITDIVGDDEGLYDDIHKLELSMARKVLGDNKSAIVARGFSTEESIQPYLDIAEEHEAESIIIKLDADINTLKKRVVAPERKNDFNPTIDPMVLISWIKSNPQERIKNEHVVDASPDIEEVLRKTKLIIG